MWHWASPAYVMKFAEIVTFAQTDPVVTDAVVEVAKRCGKPAALTPRTKSPSAP